MAKDVFPNISIKKYRSLKSKLQKIEPTNYGSIFIIPCSGDQGWYEMAEHSALFYYYDVIAPLHLKTKFFADTMSFYDQYQIGFIRAKGTNSVREHLKQLDLYASESKNDEMWIFKLKTPYTQAKINQLMKKEYQRRLNNLTPGQTDNLDPELHHLITETATRLHRICNSRLDHLSSEINGADLIRLTDNLLECYHQITMLKKSDSSKIKAKLTKMREDVYALIIKIKVMSDAKLWDLELCASVSEPITKIRDRIEQDITKFKAHGETLI